MIEWIKHLSNYTSTLELIGLICLVVSGVIKTIYELFHFVRKLNEYKNKWIEQWKQKKEEQ